MTERRPTAKRRRAGGADSPEPAAAAERAPSLRGKPKVVGYARCSTREQGEALEGQVARLERAGAEVVFQELESGGNNERPELMRLIRAVCSGKVQRILVTRGDRLGRDDEFVSSLIGLCGHYEVPIEALDGGRISHATPQDFMMAKMITIMSDFERRMLSMRIRRAFDGYRLEGRPLRGVMPFGYRSKNKLEIEPDPDRWEAAKQIIETLRRHSSINAAANEIARSDWCEWKPSGQVLTDWFCNPILRGHVPHGRKQVISKRMEQEIARDPLRRKTARPYYSQGWKTEWEYIAYDRHLPLLSEDEWHDLAAKLRRGGRNFGKGGAETREARYGLTGLSKCMSCGFTLRRQIDNSGQPWWRCLRRDCRKRASIKEAELLAFVIKEAGLAASRIMHLPQTRQDHTDDPKLVELQGQLDQARLLESSNPEVFGPAVRHLQMQIETVRRSFKQGPDPVLLDALGEVANGPEFLEGAAPDEQRAIFSGLLLEVRVGHVVRIRAGLGRWEQLGEIPLQALPRSF